MRSDLSWIPCGSVLVALVWNALRRLLAFVKVHTTADTTRDCTAPIPTYRPGDPQTTDHNVAGSTGLVAFEQTTRTQKLRKKRLQS